MDGVIVNEFKTSVRNVIGDELTTCECLIIDESFFSNIIKDLFTRGKMTVDDKLFTRILSMRNHILRKVITVPEYDEKSGLFDRMKYALNVKKLRKEAYEKNVDLCSSGELYGACVASGIPIMSCHDVMIHRMHAHELFVVILNDILDVVFTSSHSLTTISTPLADTNMSELTLTICNIE